MLNPAAALQHDFPFDPTYGYDLKSLMKVGAPDRPADFETFWKETYAQTLAVPTRPTVRVVGEDERYIIHEIEYDGLGGFRVGGWLVVPQDAPVERGVVISHGYGGREAPELPAGLRNAAIVFPCARGFHRSAAEPYPGDSARHVLHGIESREAYSHRYCVADIWSAATVLLEHFPQLNGRLGYVGGSFGGGIGAMAMPWDNRFNRAVFAVPSFGNHPLRLTLQCTGSGEFVRRRFNREPRLLDVLQYYDAATHASQIRQPTLVSCALFDPAVPPPGQFAVYNAIPADKRLLVRTAGHFEYDTQPADDEAFLEARNAWLMETSPAAANLTADEGNNR